MTTSKKLLFLSLVCLAAGFAFVCDIINVEAAAALYIALPLGAIFLGLFMISKILEKEFALYDAEVAAHSAASKTTASKSPESQRVSAPAPARNTQAAR